METGVTILSCIYAQCDPRDGSIRYIGKTNNIEQRRANHFTDIWGKNEKSKWMRELRQLGLRPDIKIIEQEPFGCCIEHAELYWIYMYLEQGVALTNDLTPLGKYWREQAMQEKARREER